MEVNINKEITIGELINKTRELMGDNKFSYYNAVRNNCQVFIFSILKANNLLNNENANFVKQDTKTLLQKEKTLQFLGKTATDLGAIMDRVIDGNGL
jgi:hypothetical protein